jgi:hypothetical protein
MVIELSNGEKLIEHFEDVHSLGALHKFITRFLCSENHTPDVQIKNIQIFSPVSMSEFRRIKAQLDA